MDLIEFDGVAAVQMVPREVICQGAYIVLRALNVFDAIKTLNDINDITTP